MGVWCVIFNRVDCPSDGLVAARVKRIERSTKREDTFILVLEGLVRPCPPSTGNITEC